MIITRKRIPGMHGSGPAYSRVATVLVLASFIMAWAAAVFTADASAEPAVSVLCYHSFIEKKKMDPFSFTIDELSSHITQLKKEGFRFVSINDVISGRISGTKNILITVDDGNKSVYEAHQKVFRPNGIRPLLGIYPNIIINKKHYALTWEQLTELASNGCDIAGHGYFHLKINKKLHDKNPGYFKKEIFLVKKVLEEKLNRKITVFVYPFGLRDDLTIKTLREAGYRYAFTINNGRIDIPLAGGGDRPYELPRYMVTRTSWKYCFNSVMRNARHKTAYKVAAADEASMEKTDMSAVNRAPAERHDPAAELQARLTESMEKAPLMELKAEKKEKQPNNSHSKKKIEKKTDLVSDAIPAADEKKNLTVKKSAPVRIEPARVRRGYVKAPALQEPVRKEKTPEAVERKSAKREKIAFKEEEGGAVMAPPIQRVLSNVRRDVFALNRPDDFSNKEKHASVLSLNIPPSDKRDSGIEDAAGRDENAASLQARVAKGTNPYHSKMKDRYYSINAQSYDTYRGFVGLIRGKIDRIKFNIRKYVLSNF